MALSGAILEDCRLELTNNQAERSMKSFVMGRKNWLLANTPGGAQSSAVMYSLMETAKETGLDPYRYLTWVLEQAPVLAEADDAWAEKLVPGERRVIAKLRNDFRYGNSRGKYRSCRSSDKAYYILC